MTELVELTDRLLMLTARWDPFLCSAIGIPDGAALLPLTDPAEIAALRADFVAVGEQLAVLADPPGSGQDSYTLQMARWQADLWPRILDSRREEFGISPYKAWCLPTAIWSVMPKVRVDDPDDEHAVTQRMLGLPAALTGAADALARGAAAGRTAVRRLAQGCADMLDTLLSLDSGFAAAIAPPAGPGLEPGWPQRFAALAEPLRPALAAFRQRLYDEVLPAARDDDRAGVWAIPGGEAAYQASVAEHTTTDLTADEIHRIGLDAVAELAAGVLPRAAKALEVKDIASLVERLRSDPELRYRDREEMLEAATAALQRGQAVLGDFVGTLPRAGCEIRPMPDLEAARMMVAYYRPGDADLDRPGIFWLNTDLDRAARRYELATLVAHESVPGHHVQWSLAREVELPRYRTLTPTTAFIEGWAMYCESNGERLGLVADDLAAIGVWSSLSWRASRLVVDTGLHAKGWGRSRAVEYLMANTATSLANAEGEVDRYLGNPGQALAYYTGLRALRQARHRAEDALGDRFDLRAFHDRVLSLGSPPLPVLARAVDDWVTEHSPASSTRRTDS